MAKSRFLGAIVLIVVAVAGVVRGAPRAAVVDDALPEMDAEVTRELAEAVRAAGYEVTPLTAEGVADPGVLSVQRFDLLVVPNARSLPLASIPAVKGFLEGGGDLIACGLPAWDSLVIKVNGQWLTRAQRQAMLNATRAQRVLADFGEENLGTWRRSSNHDKSPTKHEVVAGPKGSVLRVTVPELIGWDTFIKDFPDAFAAGQSLTCFRARGGARTKQMIVEWQEKDGSRWIATVDLTTAWKDYVLTPADFAAWLPPKGRGGAGDRLSPENAVKFSVGLGMSHGGLEGGAHEYEFADLGTAANPLGEVKDAADVPHLEGISPGYLFYDVTMPATLMRPIGPVPDSQMPVQTPEKLMAMHPRPGGAGYDKERPWRWEPLLFAAAGREYRGAVATRIVHLRKNYRGGVWATFTPAESSFYRQPAVQGLIRFVAATMRRGVFLAEGGAGYYTVMEGQTVPLGARVTRVGAEEVGNLTVRIAVVANKTNRVMYQRSWQVRPGVNETVQVTDSFRPHEGPEGGYRVVTDLTHDGTGIDRLQHDLHVWRAKEKPRYIEARDGGLWLEGKPWKAHGVNYMPSSGVGLAEGGMFEYWVGAAAYDPEVIDRDLRRIKGMNLNSVSVFVYHRDLAAQNMLDFLRRCEALGLRVNLSLRPGTPLDFRWDQIREMIEKLKLAQNDTVFAYDLAWEPSHYDHNYQKRYAGEWKGWIERRYGTVEAAEKVWGVAAPREGEQVAVPPMRQLMEDGAWRKMVGDYRLFLDEMLGAKYAEARRLVRSIDAHHAVSFRMQMAGDPTFNSEGLLPYDFYGLRDAVDIWEPEAYGRIGDWERVKHGHFTAAYARLCDASKPVVWAEMGVSAWDNASMAAHPDKLDFQARYYRDFYRMMRMSRVDGVFFWWYPGGYRLNEKSDYGIINPDGTDRAVTKVIREEAGAFLAAGKRSADVWMEVERDADARGLVGMYEKVKERYWEMVEEGRVPGLRWGREPGVNGGRK